MTDSSPSALAAGAVALDVSNQPVDFDDVQVSTGGSALTTLLTEDFAGGSLLDWNASPLGLSAGWQACGGAASYDGGGHTQIYRGSASWTDYTVAAKVRVATAADFPAACAAGSTPRPAAATPPGSIPARRRSSCSAPAPGHIDDPATALLAEANVGAIAPDVFHTLALTFAGSQITVSWNGATVIQVSDSGGSALSAGAVALDVSDLAVDFDDLHGDHRRGRRADPLRRRLRSGHPRERLAGLAARPLHRLGRLFRRRGL